MTGPPPGPQVKIKVLDIINTAASARELLLNRVCAVNGDPRFENWVVCGPGRHTDVLAKVGIHVHVIDSPPGVSLRYVSPTRTLSAFIGLFRLIRRERFSIVHTHASVQGVIGRLAAWMAGVPVIIHTEHGSIFFEGQSTAATKLYMGMERFMARFTDHLLYQNPFELEYALHHNLTAKAKTHFVGNGIDLTHFDRRMAREAKTHAPGNSEAVSGRTIIVSVARLDPIKNVGMLLRAAEELRRHRSDWEIRIVGDGICRSELEQFVASRGLGSNVRFLGYCDDVPGILAQGDIAVLTSIKEGLPRGLMEPMAMGLPVVATDVKGNRQVVVEGKCGFLVPLDDHVALAQRLVRLIDDADLRRRMGEEAYRRARESFDERSVIRNLLSIYREACLADASPQAERFSNAELADPASPESRSSPAFREESRMAKRCFDVLVALCALLITWPLIAVGALLVKLTSPGPVFYRSKRAGLGGKPFEMLKLRTMHVGLDSPDRRVTEPEDARVTRVGKLLRHTKLDELPQLWNVLRGDMSIVGPRPEDWDIVQRHFSPEQRRILDARPGIASPVDVNWYPDLTYYDPPPRGVPIQDYYIKRHMPIQVAEGIRYVERHNLLVDLVVIARLVYCVTIYSWRPPVKERPLPAES